MKIKKNPVWSAGIEEILCHAKKLIDEASPSGQRISLILIDNAMELILKTYLSLPTRETGVKLTRKELEAAFQSFPALIETFEKYFPDKLAKDRLSEIEVLHKVRNQLYHEGSNLTVTVSFSVNYFRIVEETFSALFVLEYCVESGDTLGKISNKLFGTTKYWKLIAAKNRIASPKELLVGMLIQIPLPWEM